MAEVTVKCTLLTPAFLGGADNRRAELRLPSVVGELRYWLRALAARACDNDLRKVKLVEEAVFGSQRNAGIRLHLEPVRANAESHLDVPEDAAQGFLYLAGPGLFMGGRQQRDALVPDSSFVLRMQADDSRLRAAYAALLMLVRFGGIGARARRGFGALAATRNPAIGPKLGLGQDLNVVEQRVELDIQWSVEQVSSLWKKLNDTWSRSRDYDYLNNPWPGSSADPPGIPGFSSYRLICVNLGANANPNWWQDAMNTVGVWFRDFRSGGNPRTQDYIRVVGPFMSGASVAGALLQNDSLGLPTEYRSNSRNNATATLTWRNGPHDNSSQNRRASPLWISFAKAGPHVLLSLLVLNSQFLPDGAEEVLVPRRGCTGAGGAAPTPQTVATGDVAYLADELENVPPDGASILCDLGWPQP